MTYLETLHRIPGDIILAIAAHDFDEGSPLHCVCGWAAREYVARKLDIDPSSNEAIALSWLPERVCLEAFGGTLDEWQRMFSDICYYSGRPAIEEAFVDRLNEIVR